MSLAIRPNLVNTSNLSFSSKNTLQTKNKNQTDKNPITRSGEASNLIKATFAGGLAVGGKLLCELIQDGDFVTEKIVKTAQKNADKKPNLTGGKKVAFMIASAASIIGAIVCAIALLYTIIKSPKIAYESKVNTFKKSKEMDTYIKSNTIEKELYSKITQTSYDADDEKKKALQKNYETLALAKNKTPDFVKI